MKISTLKNEYVYFTHRPKYGMSVGFYAEGNRLIVASSLVYDGTNCELIQKKRKDQFSRKEARKRIVSKIHQAVKTATLSEGAPPLTFDLTSANPIGCEDMKRFMWLFRNKWKPDPRELDPTNDPLALGSLQEWDDVSSGLRTDAWGIVTDIANDCLDEVMRAK